MPYGWVSLAARTARGGEFQLEAICDLDDIHAAFLHFNEEIVRCSTSLEAHIDCALVEIAVGVCLQSAWHADRLSLDIVTIDRHGSRCCGRVIGYELK